MHIMPQIIGRVRAKSGLTIVDQDDPDDCDDHRDCKDTVRYESFESHGESIAPSEVTVHMLKKSRKKSKKSKKGDELEESLM